MTIDLRDRPTHETALTPRKEREVKLELAPTSLPLLNKIPLLRSLKVTPKRAAEVSVYFDTDKHKLLVGSRRLINSRFHFHHEAPLRTSRHIKRVIVIYVAQVIDFANV